METWQKAKRLIFNSSFPMEVLYIFSFTILSLLFPLSFLLLTRLSGARYYLQTLDSIHLPEPSPSLFSLLLNFNPGVLYVVVSLVSIATLLHGLTGKVTFQTSQSTKPALQPRFYTAWALLCALQVSVGLGIEGCICVGIDEVHSTSGAQSLISRVIFFLGLHETMLLWSRLVVKPVVDDTILGNTRDQKWIERVVVAVSFGILWWWRLRDEVETLVVMAEAKREQAMDIEVSDFVSWWLYYLTVTIGMVRIIKGSIWVVMILLCRKTRTATSSTDILEPVVNDDKV